MSRPRGAARWRLLPLCLCACVHTPRPTDHLFAEFTVQGHRGAAGLAPENTLPAFHAAAALGVGFELDTQLSADGVAVVFHDDDLTRLTGTAGTVAATPWSVLRDLEAGRHFDPRFAGTAIPTLAEVLERHGHAVVINVEIKADRDADVNALADAVVEAIEREGLTTRVLVTSFSPFALEAVRARNPEIRRGQIYMNYGRDSGLRPLERLLLRKLAFNRRARPDVLSVHHPMVDADYLDRMHRRGYRVFAWTVNEPTRMRELLELGVDGIITDRPDVLLALTRGR